ncbi:endogenous retrovirus group K member 5 Gag polyprotein-like [Vidua chalybeata]|uniref:endogenous retrovirus group K member 5 Gag polyprotein-like n=1 Tax=Vidua chalybeata TaxID=81927 RepID=UPI0023A79504|nr:endogenous retrovirus group K member 5 Gag polyprotein-like [Vidua chalybeata]
MLKATFNSNTLVPTDLKCLFSCLLPPSEYRMWERTWKRFAGDLLPGILQTHDYAKDIEGDEITLEHLVGEEDWNQAQKQAAGIPKPVLDLTKDAAEQAFLSMPSKEPIIPYIALRQSVSEPFMDFVDRVRDTVEKKMEGQEARAKIMFEIVTTNANDACRRVIMALPASPPPMLDRLIEECTRKATLRAEDLVESLQEKVVPPTSATPETPTSSSPPPKRRCFYCSQEGHFISQCPFQGTAPPQGGREEGGEFSNQQKILLGSADLPCMMIQMGWVRGVLETPQMTQLRQTGNAAREEENPNSCFSFILAEFL